MPRTHTGDAALTSGKSMQLVKLCAVLLLVAVAAAACARPKGRLEGNINRAVGVADATGGPLNVSPESVGLPPKAQLESSPASVLRELLGRATATSWTVRWQVATIQGDDVGTMALSHLADKGSGTLHLKATMGDSATHVIDIEMLDDGNGARGCVRQNRNPWVCDGKSAKVGLEFLSIEGLMGLLDLLPRVLEHSAVTVQYRTMTGTPTACFSVSPLPMTGDTLGLDFSGGGNFCVSSQGALLALEAGETNLRAYEYTPSAEPATFALPVGAG